MNYVRKVLKIMQKVKGLWINGDGEKNWQM